MGIRESIQKAVAGGLDALGNLQDTIQYNSAGTTTYNATTGSSTTPMTTQTVKGQFVRYKMKEIDGDAIRIEDQKCLIGATVLTVEPTLNDTITRGSQLWVVQGATIDPAGALWVIQVRRP